MGISYIEHPTLNVEGRIGMADGLVSFFTPVFHEFKIKKNLR